MSTCKDCLHIDVCEKRNRYHADVDEFTGRMFTDMDRSCEHFKDRSKFIELPCKVGEDLYRLKTINGKTIITTTQLNQNTLWRIVFGGEYGKTVFLTKEEAEKALEERSE